MDKQMELVQKLSYTLKKEERAALIAEYLEESKMKNELIYKFVEETNSTIVNITRDFNFIKDDGMIFYVDDNQYASSEGMAFYFCGVLQENWDFEEDEEKLLNVLKSNTELIKNWVSNSNYVSSLKIKCADYGHKRQYEFMVNLMNNDSFFSKYSISSKSDTFLVVNKTLDSQANFDVHKLLGFEKKSPFSPQRNHFINASLITIWLAKYDIDSGADYLDDEGSVLLTKEWVECRIKDASKLLEVAEAETLSFYDAITLKSAISNTLQFADDDDYHSYVSGMKFIKEQAENNYDATNEESHISYPGWEETATTVLPRNIVELIEFKDFHISDVTTFNQTLEALENFYEQLKLSIEDAEKKFKK